MTALCAPEPHLEQDAVVWFVGQHPGQSLESFSRAIMHHFHLVGLADGMNGEVLQDFGLAYRISHDPPALVS